MSTPTTRGAEVTAEAVRDFIQEYFDAWKGTDEKVILSCYSDDVILQLPTGALEGKAAVREGFVRPFIKAFPGNVHAIRNLAHAPSLAAVEWVFTAVHKADFGGHKASGKPVELTGCSFYFYEWPRRVITEGRIYFDLATLVNQIRAASV